MRARGLVALGCVLAACFSPNPPLGAPCNSNQECPDGQECDLVRNVCTLPTEVLAWRDDTADDFAAGTYLDEVTVEAQGFVGPAAYYTGGAKIIGIPMHVIPDETTTTFEDVIANAATGTAVIVGLDVDFGSAIPPGFGFASGDGLTFAVEGEIFLDAVGTWRFQLTANDRGFFDLAPRGSATFQRVVSDADLASIGSFEVTEIGWHRFRGAFADAAQAFAYDVRADSPDVAGSSFRSIKSDAVRADVGDVQGLVLEGYEEILALGRGGGFITTMALADQSYGTDPFGLPIGTSSYTLRWAGQFLIDVEGDYAFKIDSFHGHRMWIDGQQLANKMTDLAEVTVTEARRLAPGWHDIVIDTQKDGGPAGASLKFTVESGPAMVGQSFAPDHVRPVRGRIARLVTGRGGSLAIPDQAAATRTVTLDIPADFTTRQVDAIGQVSHPVPATLQLVLDPPVGGNVTMGAFGTLTGTGTITRHSVLPTSSVGTSWGFIATDNTLDMMTGAIESAYVTLLGDGGVAPFERSYRYESAVRDLGDIAALGPMTWGTRQATATETAVVRLRTCDDAAACATERWTDVTFGTIPSVPLRRFAQYQLEVTTNGDVPTAVDFVELSYSAFVAP